MPPTRSYFLKIPFNVSYVHCTEFGHSRKARLYQAKPTITQTLLLHTLDLLPDFQVSYSTLRRLSENRTSDHARLHNVITQCLIRCADGLHSIAPPLPGCCEVTGTWTAVLLSTSIHLRAIQGCIFNSNLAD